MAQYIDKDALVAEIKRRMDEHNSLANAAADNNLHNTLEANELLIRSYKNLMSFIDTLEVKEMDLDNKDEWKNTGGFGSTWNPDSPDYCPD